MKRFRSFICSIGIVISIFYLALTVPSTAEGYYTNMPASVVVGQNDFNSNSAGTTANTLKAPWKSMVDVEGRLIVADTNNNRVLIWNQIPTKNGIAADLVLGQADFVSGSANRGGSASANTLSGPRDAYSDGTRLFVADYSNGRVLIWNSFPTQNGQAADVVVGKSSMAATTAACTQGGASGPYAIHVYNQQLIVADYTYNRITIWNSIPTTNGAEANIVLGQSDFSTCSAATTSAYSITKPAAVSINNSGKLFITEDTGRRVLVWNTFPSQSYQPANVVIGQPDFTTTDTWTTAANTFFCSNLRGVFVATDRVFISDCRRLLIFNSIPAINNANADIVLGQSDFTTSTLWPAAANTFAGQVGVYEYNNMLLTSESTNNRILIFPNTINSPRLGVSSLGGIPLTTANSPEAGRLRISGNLSVDGGLYNLWKMEASVNGGDYTPVTSLANSVATNSTHNPGTTDTVSSSFSHDFEPWNLNNQSTGNGDKQDWINNQSKMLSDYGYTLKLKGYTNNTDTNPIFFLFKPFTIISPTNTTPQGNATAVQLPTLSRNPTITFSVNTKQRQELKENLVHYEVWIKSSKQQVVSSKEEETTETKEQAWQKYIDGIPIDYDTVRDYEDNLRKGQPQLDETTKQPTQQGDGNGTYENNNLIVTFSNNSSQISVRKKSNQDQTVNTLSSGIYQLKLVSVDKANHPQDSDNEITVKVIGSPQINNPKNLSITTDWFPLQINSIQGSSPTGIINQDTTQTTFQTSNLNPTINGIAFTDTTITLTVTDSFSGEYRTYTTTAQDSKWTITPTLYSSSFLDLSVESVEGKYNELPTVTLSTVGS